jgi:hypothetical protein
LSSTSFTCFQCDPNCLTTCTAAGYCTQCSSSSCSSCTKGYGLKAVGALYACYPCATKCTSGCATERAGCCDVVPGTSAGTCSAGTYTAFNSTCHYCY